MPTVENDFTFFIEDNPSCWTGRPSLFELRLMRALPVYALEQLRLRVFHAVTTDHSPIRSARALVQMAHETEIQAALKKLITLTPEVLSSKVCERRRYLEIDADLRRYSFLFEPALTAMLDAVPATYARLLRRYIASDYARYRVSAICALLCLATVKYIADIELALERTIHEEVTVGETTAVLLTQGPVPEFIASTSGWSGINSDNIAIAKPTGTQEGDIMVAMISCCNAIALLSEPAGWLHVTDSPIIDGDNQLRCAFMYKIAGAAEPSTYTWVKGSSDFVGISGGIVTVRNVHSGTPIDSVVFEATNGGGTVVYPEIFDGPETTSDHCMLIGFHAQKGSNNAMDPWSPGFAEDFELISAGVTHLQAVHKLQAAAGPVGTLTVGDAGMATSPHISALIALAWAS